MKKWLWILFLSMLIHTSLIAQSLTSIVLPQYIQGNTGTNANRIPFAYRARLSGLSANAIYRYYNQVVISTDAATANGAGNCIFASKTGSFVRTTNPGLKTAGTYDSLTTDGTGAYEGWFIIEPTGSGKFVPGKYIFMRIILNDGAAGSTAVTRITTTDSVRVVKLDPAVSDSTGTCLRGTSSASPKDFIFTYDNTTGTGRPISGSFVESDGTDNTTAKSYASFYGSNVNGVNGAFGVVLPNALANGVRRIEQRSLLTGSIIAAATDADGIWPSGVNTVNPAGGTTEIVLAPTDVQLTTDVQHMSSKPEDFALFQNYPNPFNPSTMIKYQLPQMSNVTLLVYDILGREVTTLVHETKKAGYYSVEFNAASLPSGIYFYKLTAGKSAQTKQMILVR
ncbi:MAG: T9SS type A sorting domain-containing protein [Ignavibacteriales bacterium]|nr:T9SS type A sorting domain-containing protein [Ignavibacteriales bacterium]